MLNVVTGALDAPRGALFADALPDMVAITSGMLMDQYPHKRSRVGSHPVCRGDLPSCILVDEIMTPGPEQIRALVMTAGNPVLSMPRGNERAEAMRTLECAVDIDFYMNETAAPAQYFLPATTFLEREDLPLAYQNLMTEPFVQWTDPVIRPLGEAKPESEIFSTLGEAMGLPFLNRPLLDRVRLLMRLAGRRLSATHVADLLIRTGPCGDRLLPWRNGLRLEPIRKQPHGWGHEESAGQTASADPRSQLQRPERAAGHRAAVRHELPQRIPGAPGTDRNSKGLGCLGR